MIYQYNRYDRNIQDELFLLKKKILKLIITNYLVSDFSQLMVSIQYIWDRSGNDDGDNIRVSGDVKYSITSFIENILSLNVYRRG